MRSRGGREIPLALSAAAFVLAFVQRAGVNSSDTKIDLHVDPLRFLGQVASVWSPTASLGHVQGGQYSGYLWPMGPFFAVGRLIGLSPWVVERLWLGTLLSLAAWGAVRLTDVLLDRRRGVAHVVAGAAYVLNPYVVVFTSRTSVFLLAYAALPWLLVTVHHGLRAARRWWWAAAFALIIASTAGGVNATVTAMILLGPALLAAYEMLTARIAPRAVLAFGWRTVLASIAASVWWIVPLLVQSSYGLNFLRFTEQVGSIWATTSLTESVRLMGYWPSYIGVGYADRLTPYFGDSGTLLFNPAVVTASLLVPALALASYAWVRRRRYAPFFLLSALVALLVMTVAFPDGTPGRKAVTFLYNHVSALQFLRTTYKAGPLLALAVALLAAAAAQAVWARVTDAAPRVALAAGTLALLVLSALPMLEGRALELTWSSIPAAWRQAGADLDRTLPANSRALVLPGQAFAFYRWGGTVDPILPALTKRPVAVRNVPPYDDLHAVDYLWTVDGLVQQQRLLPGQLPPLLSLMSARAVLTATDDDTARSGAMPPAAAARELAGQPGFARAARSYGPVMAFPAPQESAEGSLRLPEVRRYDVPARGLVRVEPTAQPSIVDGAAEGIAAVAALGALPESQAVFYAGDLAPATLRARARAGANIFITDSNRRRVFVASRTRQNVGWTLPASEPFSADAAVLDPFPAAGSAGQTVAMFDGARYVTAPFDPEIAEFPEHAPIAAFDGDPVTSWQADPTLDDARHWIEVGLEHPRDIPYIDLLEDQSNPSVHVTRVMVGGRSFAVHPGWNRLPVLLRHAGAVRVTITALDTPDASNASAGGIAEIRIPGVSIHQLLRPPVLAEQALRDASLEHSSLTYVFERTTADDPLQRGPAPMQTVTHGDRLQAEAALVRQAQDPERGIARVIDPPGVRRFTVSGLATASPSAPDPALDRLAGTRTRGSSFSSSGRVGGRPGYRASAAFDRSGATAWVAPFSAGQPAWIAWRTSTPHALRRLHLTRGSLPVRFPALVSIAPSGGGATVTAPVRPDGTTVLPRPLRARGFRLTVLRAAGSRRPAVAIAEIAGPGIPRAVPAAPGSEIRGRCGDLSATLGGRHVALRASASVAQLDGGAPLHMMQCAAGGATLPAAQTDVTIAPSTLWPLLVMLRSPAPAPPAGFATVGSGTVTDPGHEGRGSYTGVRVDVRRPSWLVLGESFNRGWRASCDGHSLGAPAVIDGFANGWRVNPGCTNVSFSFAPQTFVTGALIAGGMACAVLLIVLVLRRPRLPAPAPAADVAAAPPGSGARRWRTAHALLAGVLAAAAFGFGFGLRAGVAIGPAYALILWRGVGTRRLVLAAGALLVLVVPLLYLAVPGTDQGGYDNDFAQQHLGAHWVAVAAFALLALALARDLNTAICRARRDRAAPHSEDASARARA